MHSLHIELSMSKAASLYGNLLVFLKEAASVQTKNEIAKKYLCFCSIDVKEVVYMLK